MQVTKKLIVGILKMLHPNIGIDTNVCDNLETLFNEYTQMNPNSLLNILPEELQKAARREFNKKQSINSIIEYLLAEILELTGNCAKDYKKFRITLRHMWVAILNDQDLVKIFPKPYIPVLPKTLSYQAIAAHGLQAHPLKNNIVDKAKKYNFSMTQDVHIVLHLILREASNTYLQQVDIINKIISLDKTFENSDESVIRQLHNAILDMLFNKLKDKNATRVTFNILNQVASESQNELDFLIK